MKDALGRAGKTFFKDNVKRKGKFCKATSRQTVSTTIKLALLIYDSGNSCSEQEIRRSSTFQILLLYQFVKQAIAT